MRYFILLTVLAFVGCSNGIDNAEIVKQTKFCRDNGMGIKVHRNFAGSNCIIFSIECDPTKKP